MKIGTNNGFPWSTGARPIFLLFVGKSTVGSTGGLISHFPRPPDTKGV